MGDAADDAYEAAERAEYHYQLFMNGVRDSCSFSVLGRKPCYMISNLDDDADEVDVDKPPYRCGHCGKEFDYF